MSKSFIDEARSIVMDKMADENFGVSELASLLNLSSSQTLRKVKAATGKSVNQYIRELRLEKASKLLKKTDDTVAEIAYQVGFNSASYFNKTFSKYYGIAPGEYKTKNIDLSELETHKSEAGSRNFSMTKKLIYAAAVMLIVIIGYFLINNFTSNKNQLSNSIAVLPFKDFSPMDNQWFSDGISDNILHSLAQMKSLTVTSFTSSSTFRNSDKKIPEIAIELGVSYILEGSVTLLNNKIKIIVQLIDSNDKHVWSKEYNDDIDDLISIQNNVAQEVMNQLHITLNPQEEVTLTKYPTENIEAYSLFLKGRLINDSRRKDDLLKNIELNKQAIALDSNFAEAYAEIAHSYWQLVDFHGVDAIDSFKDISLAHKYADLAIKIKANTYRALMVKAGLYRHVDWNKSREYYEKSLAVNPNDALTHLQFALYFQTRPNPDIKKYLEQLSISQQLNPISRLQAMSYMRALIFNNKIEEAEEFLKRNAFQFNDYLNRQFTYKLITYKNKNWSKVIPYLKAKSENDPDNDLYYQELAFTSNSILNDISVALSYMEKAYEIDSLNFFNVVPYAHMLIEDKKYEEAHALMMSKNYKSVVNKRFQKSTLWYFHYIKGESEKALEVSRDTLLTNDYLLQGLTYAQLDDRKKVDSINKRYPHGNDNPLIWRTNRAIIHAVLKDRDSMYYYLENSRFDDYELEANGRREFDPYRHEERYKAFLRMNYLPVPEDK